MLTLIYIIVPILFVALVGFGLACWSGNAEEALQPVQEAALEPEPEHVSAQPVPVFRPLAASPDMKRWSADEVVAALEARLLACQLEVAPQRIR